MIGLLTAVYGDYDTLKPFTPQSVEVDAICVTDDPNLAAEGWRIVVQPLSFLHPNRAAKRPKMQPWHYTDATESVWVDASFRITSPTFVKEALSYAEPLAQFTHPWRDCAYDEAVESARLPKYEGQDVLGQVEYYRSLGMPESWGLWATGCIAMRHTPEVKRFGYDWLNECWQKTYQDQLSEPYCLWDHGLRPVSLPGTHFANPWLAYEGSGRH